MSKSPEMSDKSMQRIALGIFLCAIGYALSTVEHFVSQPLVNYWDKAGDVMVLIGAMTVVWGSWDSWRSCSAVQRRDLFAEDSFLMQVFVRSCTAGFVFGWAALNMLRLMDNTLGHLPPDFFMQTALAIMLGAVGIKFFALSRDSQSEA